MHDADAPFGLHWTFTKGFSVQHTEPSKLAKPELHRRLRHCDVF
jgi:hypothetical protein